MVRQRNRTIQHRGVPEHGGVQRSSGSGSRVIPGLMIYRVDRVSGELAVASLRWAKGVIERQSLAGTSTATGLFLIDGNFRIWCSASLFLPLTGELAKDTMGGCMRTLTPVDLPCFSHPMHPALASSGPLLAHPLPHTSTGLGMSSTFDLVDFFCQPLQIS